MFSFSYLKCCRNAIWSGSPSAPAPVISSINMRISSIRVISYCTSDKSWESTAVLTPSPDLSLSITPAYSFLISLSITYFTDLTSSRRVSSLTIYPTSCVRLGTKLS